MELTINNKDYLFTFGVKFVRELDKQRPIEQNGIRFGLALSAAIIPELKSTNIATLADVLYLANRTENPRLKQAEIDNYLDECEDIEALFDEVLKELGDSNAGKLAMRQLESRMKQAEQR
ncbi:hypothetical protein RV11_GL002855 [Enterococcus phoeniculicola]|uniref:Phage protein n=1 Tax=Enterococcus phoeniculicola ATCC BAA-412 TaxID=1158610 RepID=R3TKN4_9ENTE|nr:tail assembly chaperone [Enterococcus phoeniculicola]EOL41623.1 hypothetical protein UC3_03187 [Enterococcus phoeniculicola ATCC BAA-412]EOT78883.1 hypothetical protein I589_00389 [Enterococcus phoeniculicola ATCC BAA-412]OJG72716.1 hypothetical protein RV11_GL002855 [Enterococcus phoeniculicola]